MTRIDGLGLPKDPRYEAILEHLNAELARGAPGGESAFTAPLLIVAGLPRSGTTLVYQLLAATGAFVYPSNVVARFYRRPVAGWRVERLLEPLLPAREPSLASRAGRTEAWHGAHELGYFWHAHLPFERNHEPPAEALASWDHRPMARELAALQSEDGRPLVVKNPVLGYVLGTLLARIPEARIAWVERAPLAVACSIYRTRLAEVGDARRWWSVRPAGVEALADRSPEEQIAFQIRSLLDARERARAGHGDRWLDLEYRAVCRDPGAAVGRAAALAGITAPPVPVAPPEPAGLGVDAEVRERLRGALDAAGVPPGL